MSADWSKVGLPRWYDVKLGKMHPKLAKLVGSTTAKIRYRREIMGIAPYSVTSDLEPFQHLLGCQSDRSIAHAAGVSHSAVKRYREALGYAPYCARGAQMSIGKEHRLFPFRLLIGKIDDSSLARLSGTTRKVVGAHRERLGLPAVLPLPVPKRRTVPNFEGPLLGYESLFESMADTQISRATGLPVTLIESRREFLRLPRYRRSSRIEPYAHLLDVVPAELLSQITGLSVSRIGQLRKERSPAVEQGQVKDRSTAENC
jgi:hypothetical protein